MEKKICGYCGLETDGNLPNTPYYHRRCFEENLKVSIHAPVRGATCYSRWMRLCPGVSIHAPVRGATSYRS